MGLMKAARYGTDKMVEPLIPVSDVKASDKKGKTALMDAARSRKENNEKSVELLIPVSHVKATDVYGETALMNAAGFGTAKMVELLIPLSNVKATNSDGEDALYYALFINDRDCDQIVRLLKGTPSDLLFCPRNNNK